MITDLQEIESSALNLNKKDKARLADKLLQSIHGKIKKAWIDEIQKRKESLKSGEASLHSASDVINEARKRLKSDY